MIKPLPMTCCLALLWIIAIPPTLAQTFFDTPKQFLVSRPCDASRSTRTQRDPIPLKVGQAYTALGENKPTNSTHTFIEIDDERRWVALDCGQYTEATPPLVTTEGAAPEDCPPFFDTLDNPIRVRGGRADVTPPPPELDAFDLAVNELCGTPGQRVSADAFRRLLGDHPALLEKIREFTGNRVFADRPAPVDTRAFLDDLGDAWFGAHGFEHIFCGELEPDGDIGGLHFHGRYWQLQQQGLACRLDGEREPEVVPGLIYTVGAQIRSGNGSYQHPIKGYGYTLSAQEILLAATRAFLDNPTSSRRIDACLLALREDGGDHVVVFVRQSRGIRTFYPDASPSARAPSCQTRLTLP